MPKVSVISTVFNGELYFNRSVPGILRQSLVDYEWIIVDDGSNDRTPAMLAELQTRDLRVRVVSAGRQGRATALNLAVEHARTEYIANQDFDDVSYPNRLRLQTEFMDNHPEVGVLGGYYLVVNEKRGERYIRMPPIEHKQITMAMANRIPFAHTVTMFRKTAWREAGGYPLVDELIDYHLWIAIGAHGWKFANLTDIVGEHFIHADSYWNRNFTYRMRQLKLAHSQLLAINTLGLPYWTRIYPAARYIYWLLPDRLKRLARRYLAGSNEEDQPGP